MIPVHGLLLVNKPAGLTSHDVVRQIRRIFHTRKVGHAGTLDPLATGVLPVAVGDGTKILQFLLAENKSYRATLKLGITTNTLDAEGEIVAERPVPDITEDVLQTVLDCYRGEIEQLPPMFSALKKDGVPLYKLAREGKTVERELRRVTIDRLDLIARTADCITLEVDCSKGTYIRTLVSDIGDQLGCGAHLVELQRLQSGTFTIDECHTLDELKELEQPATALISLDAALRGFPAVRLNDAAAAALRYGIPPQSEQTEPADSLLTGQLVRLQIDQKLAAVGRYAPARMKEKRGDFELIRVFVSH